MTALTVTGAHYAAALGLALLVGIVRLDMRRIDRRRKQGPIR